MWPLEVIIKTMNQNEAIKEKNEEPGVPVPRDRLPTSHYLEKAKEREDQNYKINCEK